MIALAREINDEMPLHLVDLTVQALAERGVALDGAKVAVLGVAYLEDSDDTRNTPATAVIDALQHKGASVVAHDPYVRDLDGYELTRDLDLALQGADARSFVTGTGCTTSWTWPGSGDHAHAGPGGWPERVRCRAGAGRRLHLQSDWQRLGCLPPLPRGDRCSVQCGARQGRVRGNRLSKEVKLATQDLRIGVFVCDCGSNIAGAVDTEAVREYAAALPDVVVAVQNKYTCADPGQQQIQRTIRDHKLNRVVVASCSPSSYEPIFRQCIEGAGLNRYLFGDGQHPRALLVGHPGDREAATRKAKDIVNVAVARSRWLFPQEEEQISVTDAALVVGGEWQACKLPSTWPTPATRFTSWRKKPSIGGIMAQLDKVYPDIECSI